MEEPSPEGGLLDAGIWHGLLLPLRPLACVHPGEELQAGRFERGGKGGLHGKDAKPFYPYKIFLE